MFLIISLQESFMEKNCIFCKIAMGEAPADFVYQDENIIAFKDINPSAPIHILVVPRKHIRSINDFEESDRTIMADLLLCAKKIAKDQGIDKSGYKLIINVEKGGGQYVFHLHLHIIGGWDKHPRIAEMPV